MNILCSRCCAIALAFFFVYTTPQGGFALVKSGPDHGGRITIPATTPLTVQLDQAVSANMTNGRGFTVTFSEPVQIDGVLIIPAGAAGAGLVSGDMQHGRQIELNSVFVNGRSYRVTTSPITLNPKASFPARKKLTFDLMFALSLQ
jgi:hypothetical protein